MTNILSLISEEMLKRVEQEKSKFIVTAFDLPSENQSAEKDDKIKRKLANVRVSVGYEFYRNGVRLNQSVYVLRTDKIKKVLEYIEEAYQQVPDEYAKNVNIKLVGGIYENVIFDLLKSDIENLLAKIKEEVELLEADISSRQEPEWHNAHSVKIHEQEKKKFYNRAYSISRKENIIKNRIDDLKLINKNIAEQKLNILMNLINFRSKIMSKI